MTSVAVDAVVAVARFAAMEEETREVGIDAVNALVEMTGSLAAQAVDDVTAISRYPLRVVHILRAVHRRAVVTVAGIAGSVAVFTVLTVLVGGGHLRHPVVELL